MKYIGFISIVVQDFKVLYPCNSLCYVQLVFACVFFLHFLRSFLCAYCNIKKVVILFGCHLTEIRTRETYCIFSRIFFFNAVKKKSE